MRVLRFFLVLCIMTFAYNVDVNAQAAAKIGKVVKEVAKKVKPTKVVKPPKVKQKSSKNSFVIGGPKPRATYVKCGNCDGAGKVNVWNSYYGYWQSMTCNRCNGFGHVKSN